MTVDAILDAVADTAPEIRAALPGRRTRTATENPSGETQLAADVWADRRLAERLTAIDGVGAYASEEREAVVDAGEGLSVACDPLDGSSNLRSNNPMGTVVGVYDATLPAPGRDLVAAAFVLYGPVTTMVVAREDAARPTEFLLEADGRTDLGPVEVPAEPTVYGFGGRVPDWPDDFAAYVADVEEELKLRYGGAMVADVNQVLTYGGVFAYPALRSAPSGKLRAVFEGAPMAYVVEAAGGRSSDGTRSLLERTPETLHERTPVHLGDATLVDRLERTLS